MTTNDLRNIVGVVTAIAGVAAAYGAFNSSMNSVEKKGLTVATGVSLAIAGYVLLTKVDEAADRTRNLLA